MDVLVFLKRVQAEIAEASVVRRRIDELRSTLLPAGIRYDRDKVQGSPADRMPDVMGEIDDFVRQNSKMLARLTSDLIKAQTLIEKMETPEYRQLLTLRYLMSSPMSWKDVAREMGYSVDHVRGKLHGSAIREARALWNKAAGSKENTK